MSASSRRTVIVLVAALGVAFIMVLAASTGPGGMVGQLPGETSTATTTRDYVDPPAESADRAAEEAIQGHGERPG